MYKHQQRANPGKSGSWTWKPIFSTPHPLLSGRPGQSHTRCCFRQILELWCCSRKGRGGGGGASSHCTNSHLQQANVQQPPQPNLTGERRPDSLPTAARTCATSAVRPLWPAAPRFSRGCLWGPSGSGNFHRDSRVFLSFSCFFFPFSLGQENAFLRPFSLLYFVYLFIISFILFIYVYSAIVCSCPPPPTPYYWVVPQWEIRTPPPILRVGNSKKKSFGGE